MREAGVSMWGRRVRRERNRGLGAGGRVHKGSSGAVDWENTEGPDTRLEGTPPGTFSAWWLVAKEHARLNDHLCGLIKDR